MLSGIEIRNAAGVLVLTLPLGIPNPEAAYRIVDIQGLGPVKAEIATSRYAAQDGAALHGTRLGMRNIVLKLSYNVLYAANQTVEALRRDLYTYFPPEGEVYLRFSNDRYATTEIKGIVESNEPTIFSKDPEVQISILCVDSRFTALAPVVIDSYNDVSINPSIPGMGGSGFLLELFVNRTLSKVTLVNGIHPNIVFEESLIANDVLRISTSRGKKYVDRFRGGVNTGVLNGITSGSLAMQLDARTTNFQVLTGGPSDIPLKLTFTPNYVGI